MLGKKENIHHLYRRAAFGFYPSSNKELHLSLEDHIAKLFDDSKRIQPLNFIKDPRLNKGDVGSLKALLMVLKSKKDLGLLNVEWLEKMGTAKGVLRERMTLFWHDHFATSAPYAILMQEQNNTLRKHALGSFKDMVHAIAKDPAMIIYLNNQQNRKKAPNENFARELMELFTLGEGNTYTEADIKQAARCFTGWHVNQRGVFEFNTKAYDDGEKTIFGQKGNFTGEQVIDMILEKKEVAQYITTKVYKYFVNEYPNEKMIQGLAGRFYNSGYRIDQLMMDIFSSSWFYDEENVGMLYKSPVDLLVEYKRALKFQTSDPRSLIKVQKVLGQILFFPPNVAGWKGGRTWINSSSILLRMRLPLILFGSKLDIASAPNYDAEALGRRQEKEIQRLRLKAEWDAVTNRFQAEDQIVNTVLNDLLAVKLTSLSPEFFEKGWQATGEKDKIKWLVSRTMALPEFQLK